MKSISNEMLNDLYMAEKQIKLINRLRHEIVSCDFFDYTNTNDFFVQMRHHMSNFYSSKYYNEDIEYKNNIYSVEDVSFNYSCSIYMLAGDREQDLPLKEIMNAQII